MNRKQNIITNCGLCLSIILAVVAIQPAMAATTPTVGEIMGAGPGNTFGIKITHGTNVLINQTNVLFPADIKIPPDDGDAEDYVLLDTWGAGTPNETQIILKIVSEDDPSNPGSPYNPYRVTHWYVDAIAPGDIHTAGAISLFDTADAGRISVEISDIKFQNTIEVTPQVQDSDGYYTSFMRDSLGGHFYKFADAHPWNWNGNAENDIQVPGNIYHDANTNDYNFDAAASQTGPVTWIWEGLINPGPLNTMVNNHPGDTLTSDGRVHELGLSVAFTGVVPEPTTALLMLLSPLVLRRKSRR